MLKEARDSLIGITRYFTWRADASSYFTGNGDAFARSLVAYVLAFPFALAVAYWDTDLQTRPRIEALGWSIYVVEFILISTVMLGIALFAAWIFGRREHFYRYGIAANWQQLVATIFAFLMYAVDEAAGWSGSKAPPIAVIVVEGLVILALIYWTWAILYQALKLRWWQSIPAAIVMLLVSLIISIFARVVVRIESAPIAG